MARNVSRSKQSKGVNIVGPDLKSHANNLGPKGVRKLGKGIVGPDLKKHANNRG